MGRFRKRYRGIVSPLPTNQLPIESNRPLVERDVDVIMCTPAVGQERVEDQQIDASDEISSTIADEQLDELLKAGVHTERLFTQSRLYETSKPLIEIIKTNIEIGSDTTDVFKSQSAVFSDFFSDSLVYTVIGVGLGSKIWNLESADLGISE